MTEKSTPLKLELAQLSDLGMRRANNQDSLTSVVTDEPGTWMQRGHLMMVADGMGAHAAGELASKLAIDNLPHAYYKSTESSPAIALRQAVCRTNEIINTKAKTVLIFEGWERPVPAWYWFLRVPWSPMLGTAARTDSGALLFSS